MHSNERIMGKYKEKISSTTQSLRLTFEWHLTKISQISSGYLETYCYITDELGQDIVAEQIRMIHFKYVYPYSKNVNISRKYVNV